VPASTASKACFTNCVTGKSGECHERDEVHLLVARGPYDRDLDGRGRA